MELVTSTVDPVSTIIVVDGFRVRIGACFVNIDWTGGLVLNLLELYKAYYSLPLMV